MRRLIVRPFEKLFDAALTRVDAVLHRLCGSHPRVVFALALATLLVPGVLVLAGSGSGFVVAMCSITAGCAAVVLAIGVRAQRGAGALTHQIQDRDELLVETRRERDRALQRATELNDAQQAFTGIHRALEQQFLERTLEMEDLTRELTHQAKTDSLTSLLNRKGMNERLAQLLTPLGGGKPTPLALFFIDLDGFKEINDVLGHVTGDHALVLMARRLAEVLPPEAFAARWGGDEFVVVVPGIQRPEPALNLSGRLRAALALPARIDDQTVRLSGCVGISLFPLHGQTAEELLIAADLAVYKAKSDGHGATYLFDPSMAQAVERRHRLAQALPSSIDGGQISVAYQPIVSVDMREVTHVEALARWTHPQWGTISPVEFIPMAEATGAIHALGRWVLRQACLNAARWPGANPPKVSVNVSVLQLNTGNFVAQVRESLAVAKLPASRLVIEITESLPSESGGNAAHALAALREMGIMLAIDDFGTGYSSLASLRQHPVDMVKIDRSFVNGLGGEGEPIVQAAVDIARSFGLKVVAEGVETTEQVQRLARLGVRHLQGYLISKPLPDAQLHDWLYAHREAQVTMSSVLA